MTDFRWFCLLYSAICVFTCIGNWLSLGKPLSTDSMTSTMFIASVAAAISVVIMSKRNAP